LTVYCAAEFPCEFKILRRARCRKGRKYFVICTWKETCNQQSLVPVVKDEKEVMK